MTTMIKLFTTPIHSSNRARVSLSSNFAMVGGGRHGCNFGNDIRGANLSWYLKLGPQ